MMVRVVDGDTVYVLDADKTQHKIRLAGLDAPEIHVGCAQRTFSDAEYGTDMDPGDNLFGAWRAFFGTHRDNRPPGMVRDAHPTMLPATASQQSVKSSGAMDDAHDFDIICQQSIKNEIVADR